jgi:tRNA-modifying protein YgfZ
MQTSPIALEHRGVVALSGADAQPWLDNLITNDLAQLAQESAVFAGLLSPQGKLLFEFFVIKHRADLLIETHATSVAPLIKRLSLYKLRAQVSLRDASADWLPVWAPSALAPSSGAVVFADPRAPAQLWRGVLPAGQVAQTASHTYAAARIAHGIAEAPDDYGLGDTFPHEANFDLHAGVSFTKGCFVGQEVVARMQNKSVVRKRVVRIAAATASTAGADVTAGAAVIGKVGSVAGHAGLAMLRLDRAVEAFSKGEKIAAGAVALTIDAAALDAYRHAVANRPEIDL